MKGKLIVLEGLDGSGKATQAQLLHEALCAQGLAVRKVTFPDYQHPSSTLVKQYLAGEFGSRPEDVNAYAASCFYSVDRYASYKTQWGAFYQAGGIVVADRYTTSNAVHQCAKLPKQQWDFEYEKIAIPAPDMVIYLDVAPEVSQKLMTGRYHGDEDKKDIHEKDVDYLRHSRMAGAYCAEAYGWKRVPCTQGGAMRTRQAIHADVLRLAQAIVTEV